MQDGSREIWACEAVGYGKMTLFQIALLLGTDVVIPEITFFNPMPMETMQIIDILIDRHGLQVLKFSYCDFAEQVVHHIAQSGRKEYTALRVLDVRSTKYMNKMRWMSGFFATFSGLTELTITTAFLDYLNAHEIATLLIARPDAVLVKLNLWGNMNMNNRGIASLCSALKDNTTVTDLNLGNCVHSAFSAGAVAEMLQVNRTLRVLGLERMFDNADPVPFIKNEMLQELNLGMNHFTGSQLELAYAALATNTSLTKLNLAREPRLAAAHVSTIKPDVLALNSTLTDLDLSHWDVGMQSFANIVSDLTTNASLTRMVMLNENLNSRAVPVSELTPLVSVNRTLRQFNCGKIDTTVATDLFAVALFNNPVILSIGEQATHFQCLSWALMRNRNNLDKKSATLLEVMLRREVVLVTLKRHRIK